MRKTAMFILLLMTAVFAENYVVINSLDGRDVLSGIFYANVMDYPVKFMPYPGGSAELLAKKIGGDHDILLIQSEDTPVSAFVQQELEDKGNTVELYVSDDGGETNLDLALRSGATEFIVVESAYADSALSVMPYADYTNSYVILANEFNTQRLDGVLGSADKVTIYGYVDSAVREALERYDPEFIGKGEDRYEDNTEVAGLYMEETGTTSVIMVEGTFIEEGMVDSNLPLVFSGRIVPDATYDFMKERVRNDELSTVYLIGGTQITNAVRNMREQIKSELTDEGIMNKTFGIWLRFAQVIPGERGMSVLDTFPLPAYIPNLEISEVVYNKVSGNMMVTLDNLGDGPAYYVTEIHILVDGAEYTVFGDDDATLIERGDTVGLEYPLDLAGIEEGKITALVIVKYGSGMRTLEEYTDYVGGLVEVEYTDKSNVTAREIRYDSDEETVYLSVKNNKGELAYVSPSVTLTLDGEPIVIKGPYNEPIEGNSIVVVEFPIALSNEDLSANEEVSVNLKYGGRPGFLVNEDTVVLTLEKEGMEIDFLMVLLVVLIVILLLAVYLLLTRRGKKGR